MKKTLPIHVTGFNPAIPNMRDKEITRRLKAIDQLQDALVCWIMDENKNVGLKFQKQLGRLRGKTMGDYFSSYNPIEGFNGVWEISIVSWLEKKIVAKVYGASQVEVCKRAAMLLVALNA